MISIKIILWISTNHRYTHHNIKCVSFIVHCSHFRFGYTSFTSITAPLADLTNILSSTRDYEDMLKRLKNVPKQVRPNNNNSPLFILGSLFSAMCWFSTAKGYYPELMVGGNWRTRRKPTGFSRGQESYHMVLGYLIIFLVTEHSTSDEMLCLLSGYRTQAPVLTGQCLSTRSLNHPNIPCLSLFSMHLSTVKGVMSFEFIVFPLFILWYLDFSYISSRNWCRMPLITKELFTGM